MMSAYVKLWKLLNTSEGWIRNVIDVCASNAPIDEKRSMMHKWADFIMENACEECERIDPDDVDLSDYAPDYSWRD